MEAFFLPGGLTTINHALHRQNTSFLGLCEAFLKKIFLLVDDPQNLQMDLQMYLQSSETLGWRVMRGDQK